MSDPAEIVLEVERLETRFGSQTVHRDLSLQVRRGEVLAVVGGSGSGKTTLLRQLLGLERPAAGRVAVFGTDLATADAPGAVSALIVASQQVVDDLLDWTARTLARGK